MKIKNGEIITDNGGSKIIGNTHIVNDSESPIITKQKILSLDDLLDEVNYDFVGYIPSTHALMFVNFIKEVNAGEEENITPIFHLKMMDQVFNGERRIAVLCFRGASKSTLLAEYLYLFIASFGFFPGWIKMSLGLYVTDSIENGVKNLRRNVEFRYSNSEFLQKLIPNRKIGVGTDGIGYVDPDIYEEQFIGGRKFTDIRLEFKNRNGHQSVFKGFGIATGVRGVRELGVRPSLASLDDLISSDDAARSSTILQSIKSTIYKDVSKALHPTKQKIVYVGTPFNELDPLVEALNSKSWKRVVFPICEHFDSKTIKEEFRGAWEDRFPFEYVKAEYDEAMDLGNPSYFFQELMLQISSEDDRLILNSDIRWYDDVCEVIDNKQNYNFYIYTDFATSERKTSDYSIITVMAYGDDKKFRWVDGTMAKQDMWENIKDLFKLVKEYNPMGVGIEVSGQQGGFIPWIYREMNDRNIFFNIASENNDGKPGIRPVTNKFARFNVVLPYFKQKKILFPTNMKNDPRLLHAVNELSRITNAGIKSKTDDFIDTISQIPMIPVFEPQVKKATVIVSDEDADLRDKYFPKINTNENKEKSNLNSYIR